MAETAYVPETFPHRWLPNEAEFKTWDQIEPWYRQLLGPADRLARGAGSLAVRPRRAERRRSRRRGSERYIAMTCQTDDPDREAAHLAFVRDIEPKLKPIQNDAPRRSTSTRPTASGLPRGPLPRLRPRPGEPPGPLPRGQHPPRDRAGRARPAVSEGHRRDDRDLPGAGADPRADGPVPGGDRPRDSPGRPGSWSPPGGWPTATRSTTCSTG